MNRLDKDHSGGINYSEFVEGAMGLGLLVNDKALEGAFKYFDKDGSGSIEVDELRNNLKHGWITDAQISSILGENDANKDKKV